MARRDQCRRARNIVIVMNSTHTLTLQGVAGGLLVLDDEMIINNDGLHAPAELSGTLMLKSGFHKFKVLFFQKGGGKAFEVKFESPELTKQIIPAEMLFRE